MRYIALLTATAVMGMTAGAFAAANVSGSDQCGPLPNAKWSWQISTETIRTGGDTHVDTSSSVNYTGNPDKNGYNGFETTTTTTTIEPTYEQVNVVCTAVNPGGQVNADHSTSVAGEVKLVDPGSSSSTNSDPVKICGPGGNTPVCPRP
jgi:hypothetical protein